MTRGRAMGLLIAPLGSFLYQQSQSRLIARVSLLALTLPRHRACFPISTHTPASSRALFLLHSLSPVSRHRERFPWCNQSHPVPRHRERRNAAGCGVGAKGVHWRRYEERHWRVVERLCGYLFSGLRNAKGAQQSLGLRSSRHSGQHYRFGQPIYSGSPRHSRHAFHSENPFHARHPAPQDNEV